VKKYQKLLILGMCFLLVLPVLFAGGQKDSADGEYEIATVVKITYSMV